MASKLSLAKYLGPRFWPEAPQVLDLYFENFDTLYGDVSAMRGSNSDFQLK